MPTSLASTSLYGYNLVKSFSDLIPQFTSMNLQTKTITLHFLFSLNCSPEFSVNRYTALWHLTLLPCWVDAALNMNFCVSLVVNMWFLQSPELEGSKALTGLQLAQQRSEGVGGSPQLSLWKGKCVCVCGLWAWGSVCCFTSVSSHLGPAGSFCF